MGVKPTLQPWDWQDTGMFSRRSQYTLSFMQYGSIVAFVLVGVPLFFYSFVLLRPLILIDDTIVFDFECFISLLIMMPGQCVSWFSVLTHLWPVNMDGYRGREKVRKFDRLLICLVSKGDNIDASPHAY